MPNDYYDTLKEQRDSDEYREASDIVRQEIFNDSIHYAISQQWMTMEDRIRIMLYFYLRYN